MAVIELVDFNTGQRHCGQNPGEEEELAAEEVQENCRKEGEGGEGWRNREDARESQGGCSGGRLLSPDWVGH